MDPKSQPVKPTSDSDKAKKKSAVQIFKVGLFMLRRRSKKTKEPVDMGPNKGRWRRLLGSMRPLHVQGNESSPTAAGVNMSLAPSRPKEDFEELPMPLPSASPSSSSSFSRMSKTSRSSSFSRASRTSTSSSFGTSQYASANNLQELYNHNDDSDDENAIEEMIDAKAEEFISQFYEQMRRQHHN